MGLLPSASTRSDGTTITAASFNNDFSAIKAWADTYVVLTDTARTVSAVVTFSTPPVFSGGLTVSAGGAAITGNSTVTGTLGVSGVLTAASFSGSGATLTAIPQSAVTSLVSDLAGKAATVHTHAATDIVSGTIASARLSGAYTGITSVGTLGSLSVSGSSVLGAMSATTGAITTMTTQNPVTYDAAAPAALSFPNSAAAIYLSTGTGDASNITGVFGPAATTSGLTDVRWIKCQLFGENNWYVMACKWS